MKIPIVLLLSTVAVIGQTNFEPNILVSTFVGSAFQGHVNGVGEETMFSGITGVRFSSVTNLMVADSGNMRVRQVTTDRVVTTWADQAGYSIQTMGTLCRHPISENVMLAVSGHSIKSVGPGGSSYYTSSSSGYENGFVPNTKFLNIKGVALAPNGNLFIADGGNRRVRAVITNYTETFAGSGNSGQIDGTGIFSSFYSLTAIACDNANNVYVADGYRIRKITPLREVTTIAGWSFGYKDANGTNASFRTIYGMVCDSSGNIYIADSENKAIRKIKPNRDVVTLAGSGPGYYNGHGFEAKFSSAEDVEISPDETALYVADGLRVRKITLSGASQVQPSNIAIAIHPAIKISGDVGRTYQIQSTMTLTNWTTETTITLPHTPFTWFDPSPANAQSKSYRAFLLP